MNFRRLTPLALGALCVALAAFVLRPFADGELAKPPVSTKATTPRLAPAKNPTRLLLHDDGHKVVGWISGTADLTDQTVQVGLVGDEKKTEFKLDKNNSFTWPYTATKPIKVTFSVKIPGADFKTETLTETITVVSATEEKTPSVFFVVDRTAYRPAQTFHFAGFLRKLDAKGEFEPLPRQDVEVELISEKKQTKAFKVKTVSDDFGRITGSYTFTDADALDHYNLIVTGYKGTARILLGEYRKSKIKLVIKGKVKDEKAKLTFEALDFLEKPVETTKASFSAQVVRRDGKSKPTTLKAEDFAYHTPMSNLLGEWEGMPEEEMLIWQADGPSSMMMGASRGSAVVAQLAGEVEMKGKDAGEYTIDLKKEWLEGTHSIIVSGVVMDTNGREQRSTQTIPIGEPRCPGVTLELSQTTFATGDKVTVRAKRTSKEEAKDHAFDGPLTLVVMKLSPGTGAANAYAYDYGYGYNAYNLPRSYRYGRYRWAAPPPVETVKRAMVTAIPFNKFDDATLKIAEPGAYKLVAVGQREDGTNVRTEVGCVVRAAEELPGLTLKLDKEEFTAGERLTGTIQSRHAEARILLTVRDSSGLRLWKSLTLDKSGMLRLSEVLPADLRYGCAVEIQYADEGTRIAAADKLIRVVPADRMLTIKAETKPIVAPGEKVKIDLQVDRQEEVDLVVSVYDQSLLGIAADKSVDVKNFYLADERIRASHARDMLRRRLGNVTVEDLAKKAEQILEADKKLESTPEGQMLRRLVNYVRGRGVYTLDMGVMLRLAGVENFVHPGYIYYYGQNWHYPLGSDTKVTHRLIDLFDQKHGDWALTYQFVNDSLILSETHPNYANRNLTQLYLQNAYMNSYGGYNGLQSQTREQNLMQARGDARWSASGNAVHSAEGQAVLSHIPVSGLSSPELINTDPDQSHIGVRRDFSDSAFWNAQVRTDKTGKATVEFKLPDSLTNWQVVVTAVSKKMHVGQAKTSFRSFKPIMVWPMLPRVFTEGDKVNLFASVHNRTDEAQTIKVKLKVENGDILTVPEKEVVVPAKGNVPVYWTFKALQPGFTQLLMTADCAAGNDASLKRLPVSRAAAEQLVTASGMVKGGMTFEIPKDVDLKSASLEVSFAPSLAADMADTLNYLVDYPYGCVEQTMSRFLPAIKVAQVLQDFHVEHPELQKKLPGCVAGGIKRLLELQQPDGGWGWHGNGQTHEMMTPYALYGLLQAEKAGYQIPGGAAIERGLNRLKMFIDGMSEAQTADRVYCMHVYAHRRDLEQHWWDFIAAQLKKDRLSDYALALALETAVQKGKKTLADDLAKGLQDRVKKVGSHRFWEKAGFSRWGDDRFEVTAAAMKALVAYDRTDPLIDGILGFFAATKRGDRWNSTKDTAMILYAMCDYLAKERFDPKAKPEINFSVNDGAAQKVTFDNKLTQKIIMPATGLKAGLNALTFRTATTGMMYRVVFRYWKSGAEIKPMEEGLQVTRNFYLLDSKGGAPRQLKSGEKIARGSYVLSEVIATNRLATDMRYVLVENPKPACAEILPVEDVRFTAHQGSTHYVLREEKTAAVVFHHEQTPQMLTDRCVLLAELAGDYIVSPAHVEMMYRTEHRGHSGTFVLKVADEDKK